MWPFFSYYREFLDVIFKEFSVLALGDTAFDLFCEAGKEWDRVLEQKGANRIHDRVDCDVDYEDDAEEWIENVISIFGWKFNLHLVICILSL